MPVRMPVKKELFNAAINSTSQAVRGVAAFVKGYGNLTLFVDNTACAQTCIVEVYASFSATTPPTAITGMYQAELNDGSALKTFTAPASKAACFPIDISADYILLRAAQGVAVPTSKVILSIHGDAIAGGSSIGLA